MKIKKFTFIIPNTTWFGRRYWHNFPYTEALLSAVLKQKDYDVDIIDANIDNLSEEALENEISNRNPEVIGIGEMALEYRQCMHKSFEIIKKVNPQIVTIAGGVYPTLSPEIATKDKNIDFFVFGEGEEKLPALLQAIEKGEGFEKIEGIAFRKNKEFVINPRSLDSPVDLDSLPMPDYSDFNMSRYMNYQQKFIQSLRFKKLPVAITMTSRGCPYKCTFCCSKKLYAQKIRIRSPEKVLEEVDMLLNDYGAKEIIFIDDSLLWPKERVLSIMNGLIKRKKNYDFVWKSNNLAIHQIDEQILDKMKESGCYQITLSIESGCQRTLNRMKKPINLENAKKILEKIKEREFDNVSSNFVIGMPGDTWEDIRESFQFADDMVSKGLLDYVIFHIATPFPGTELYEQCKKNNYLPEGFNFENLEYYGFGKGIITTPNFTPAELHVLRAYEWDRINFKTPKQRAKIAGMLGITLEELETWRRETRRAVGLHVKSVDARESYKK